MNVNPRYFPLLSILPFLLILVVILLPMSILAKEILVILLGVVSVFLMVYGYRHGLISKMFMFSVIFGASIGFFFVIFFVFRE